MTHPQTEPGRLDFSITDGQLVITRADPVIECNGELLDRMCNWGIGKWNIPFALGLRDDLDKPRINQITFGDADHQWLYRIVNYNVARDVYTLAWPD